LDFDNVTDSGLANLSGLPQLRALHLRSTKVTDVGLVVLKGFPQLEGLALDSTKVSDSGLENIEALTKLQLLSLASTNVSDVGLKHIVNLKELNMLDLSGTNVTDVGLANLEGLAELQMLVLSKTQITDAGLAHLAGLKRLRSLDLAGTKVSRAGVEDFRKRLPSCKIQYWILTIAPNPLGAERNTELPLMPAQRQDVQKQPVMNDDAMTENPYESPTTQPAMWRPHRRIKLNAFDKFCAAIAFVFGLFFLLLGVFGVFMGCTAYITLPPILGVIPAFAGWGIVRAVYVAWKTTNRPSAVEDGAANLSSGATPAAGPAGFGRDE